MNIRDGSRILLAALLLLGGLSLCSAKPDKGREAQAEAASFLSGDFFSKGMALADAEALVADPKKWQVVFRIDTPSTCDMAVVYQRQYFWRVSFYKGLLYSYEKRGEVAPEVVEATFKALGEQHGESREATRSDDGSLIYSRWRLPALEISMTASRDPDGLYRVTYEEADTELLSLARRKQEQEMQAAPGEFDPITGKARLHKHKDGQNGNPDSNSDEEAQKGKAKQKNKAKDKDKDKDKKPPKDEDKDAGKEQGQEQGGDEDADPPPAPDKADKAKQDPDPRNDPDDPDAW